MEVFSNESEGSGLPFPYHAQAEPFDWILAFRKDDIIASLYLHVHCGEVQKNYGTVSFQKLGDIGRLEKLNADDPLDMSLRQIFHEPLKGPWTCDAELDEVNVPIGQTLLNAPENMDIVAAVYERLGRQEVKLGWGRRGGGTGGKPIASVAHLNGSIQDCASGLSWDMLTIQSLGHGIARKAQSIGNVLNRNGIVRGVLLLTQKCWCQIFGQ